MNTKLEKKAISDIITVGTVCILCVFEWVQTILATQQGFRMLVQGLPNDSNEYLGWLYIYVMPACTAAVVQSFLVWRITIISKRRLFSAIILPVSGLLYIFRSLMPIKVMTIR